MCVGGFVIGQKFRAFDPAVPIQEVRRSLRATALASEQRAALLTDPVQACEIGVLPREEPIYRAGHLWRVMLVDERTKAETPPKKTRHIFLTNREAPHSYRSACASFDFLVNDPSFVVSVRFPTMSTSSWSSIDQRDAGSSSQRLLPRHPIQVLTVAV